MMNKKWLPVVLCLLFIVAWEALVVRPFEKNHQSQKPVQTGTPRAEQVTGTSNPTVAAPATPAQPVVPGQVRPLSEAERTQASTLELGPKRTVKIFPNGTIGAAEFADYFVRERKENVAITLAPEGFHWTSTDPKVADCLTKLAPTADGAAKSFTAQGDGGTCTLRYAKDPTRTGIVSTTLTLNGFAGAQGAVEFRGEGEIGKGRSIDHNYLVFRADDSKTDRRDKKLYGKELDQKAPDGSARYAREVKQGKVEWLAWGDRYFATILMPAGKFNPNVSYGALNAKEGRIDYGFEYPLQTASASAGAANDYQIDLYFGTRDPEILAALNPTLSSAVDLGIFAPIGRIMLWLLKTLNVAVHNYGVSIILLTLFVRLIFWPLNRKVYDSSLKMKALQPEIERLKKKYAGDKSKAPQMNMELMGLYKANKVNPMGSCLPMLLQMPIFFGLYAALNHSLDLYQAPFFGWITDLSSPDPYYVLPILWTVTLIAYTRFNPQTATPQPGQPDMRLMMIAMNIFFGFLSKDWPAGLTLYLFVSNIVGVTQQFVMQRTAKKLQPVQEGA